MSLKNKNSNSILKCACKNLTRLGPPPAYLLEPPPTPPLSFQLEHVLKCPLLGKNTNSTSLFEFSTPTQINSNSSLYNQKNTTSLNLVLNSSHLFIVLVTIVILIVFLLVFILFAFIFVYLTRAKLSKNCDNMNQCSKQQESQQTVSVLTLTSPSLTNLTGSTHTSPNSTNSFSSSEVVVLDHQKLMKTFNLNSFSKLPVNENSSFKPIQASSKLRNENLFSNLNMSSSSGSSSSVSPNKQSVGNESIETNGTSSTILTIKSKLNNNLNQRQNLVKISKNPLQHQSDHQQHYYESISDLSQLYFDVDDPNMNPNLIAKRNMTRIFMQDGILKGSQVHLDFERHYPITCCSCTLLKMNNQNLDENHSKTCLSLQQHLVFDKNTNKISNHPHGQNYQFQFHNCNNSNENRSTSNLNPEQFYLKSLIV